MRPPWVIAHRGASGHAPENTFAAFQRAVELGATFIETDLHVTRDGRFRRHPRQHRRAAPPTAAATCTNFTLDELRQVDAGMWFDRDFMGERIPTLEEILEFSREHDVVFYLELKYAAVWGMDHALVAALQKAQSAPRTIVISFDPATLTPLRRLDPSIMTGLARRRSQAGLHPGGHRSGRPPALPQGLQRDPETGRERRTVRICRW